MLFVILVKFAVLVEQPLVISGNALKERGIFKLYYIIFAIFAN